MCNPQLKILLFDGSFKTTPFINRLAKGLAARHQVCIAGFNEEVAYKIPGISYLPLGSNQNKFRFVTTSLEYALRTGSIRKIFATIKSLLKGERQKLQEQNLRFALKKINPDVIHLQWPSVLQWFEEVLEKQEIPVVLSQRGFHNNVRPFVDGENFEYLQKWYPKISGFHSVSKAIAANGDKIWQSPDKIDRVVYTGLDLERFSFSQGYQRITPIKMLSVGRAHWVKGYDYALQACRILKEQNLSFHYDIIGAAGDEELQFLVADLGLEDFVSLRHRVPQSEVVKMMEEASLLLLPSVEEGVPNVVVEAMALGLPVLCTDCGGVGELIEDGVSGWVVPTRDARAMAGAILGFMELPLGKIEEVRINARKKVEAQHSEEEMVMGMEGLYREVLERFHAEDAEFDAEDTEGK